MSDNTLELEKELENINWAFLGSVKQGGEGKKLDQLKSGKYSIPEEMTITATESRISCTSRSSSKCSFKALLQELRK